MRFYDILSQHFELAKEAQSGFTPCRCIFPENHKNGDRDASAGIDFDTGVFNCFGCGEKLSIYALIEKFYPGLDESKRFELVSNRVSHEDNENSYSSKITDEAHFVEIYSKGDPNVNKYEIAQLYMKSHGVSLEALKRSEAVVLPENVAHWKVSCLAYPIRNSAKAIVGLHYRDILGRKSVDPKSKNFPIGLDKLKNDTEVVVLCEGQSDRLRLMDVFVKFKNVRVVAIQGNSFSKDWTREFEGIDKIILIGHDEPALKRSKDLQSYFGSRFYEITLPWRRGQTGKDVCDWLKYNTPDDLIATCRHIIFGRLVKIFSGKSFREYTDSLEVPFPYIKDLIGPSSLAVIGGLPKRGKTWVALKLVHCLINPGENFLGIDGICNEGEEKKVLFIQEEGTEHSFVSRLDKAVSNWEEGTSILMRSGIKFSPDYDLNLIHNSIEQDEIDVIMIDSAQKVFSGNMNDSEKQAEFWETVQRLINKYPKLAIVIIYHFAKSGVIENGWEALRGGGQAGGEPDTGIFVDFHESPPPDKLYLKVAFDGRNMTLLNDRPFYPIEFDKPTGEFFVRDAQGTVLQTTSDFEKFGEFLNWIKTKPDGEVTLIEASEHFDKTTQTIKNWAAQTDCIIITRPSRGKPAKLKYVEGT